jgi:hypothetical protein
MCRTRAGERKAAEMEGICLLLEMSRVVQADVLPTPPRNSAEASWRGSIPR